MKQYRHIFFDLDRTLWDYERNALETIKILITDNTVFGNTDPLQFFSIFEKFNEEGWMDYLNGRITKNDLRINRFVKTLKYFSVSDRELAFRMAGDFITICPAMPHLVAGTLETLEYLFGKYHLHILTNGFSDIQYIKLRNSGIEKYFEKVFTSDIAGSCKPDKKIFHMAVSSLNALKESCLMVGDEYTIDIAGAMNYGIDQAWLNPKKNTSAKKPTFTISEIKELLQIL